MEDSNSTSADMGAAAGVFNEETNIPDPEIPSVYHSRNYHQLMFDLLGNRDYDNFENNELDSLKKKIGYAFYGNPQNENGYDKKQNEDVEKIYDLILKQNDKFSKHKDRVVISFIYVCTEPLESERKKRALKIKDYDPETDIRPYPVFILRKCKYSPTSCRVIIDHSGRVYKSWEEYLNENVLPKCAMVYPKNGRYSGDSDGNVVLDVKLSPSCSIGSKILKGTDIATTGLGIASAGVAIAASIPAVTVLGPVALAGAGIAGVGVGIYSIGRSIGDLFDKNRHKEKLSVSNSGARAAYLNIAAGTMGFVGSGASVAVSALTSKGVDIGKGASLLVNTIKVANIGTSGLSIVNSSIDILQPLINDKKAPSLLVIVQLSSSILFFAHAVYSFKTTQTLIEETQSKVLKEIQESLKCNKNRKTFERLRTEAIRRNNGIEQKGNAEIIAVMRKIIDKDQFFQLFSKTDEDLERLGIKLNTEKSGLMTFNGIPIEMNNCYGFSSENLDNFLSLPKSSDITPININEIKENLSNTFKDMNLDTSGVSKLSNYFVALISSINNIAIPILTFTKIFIQNYIIKDEILMRVLNELFPNTDEKCLKIINSIVSFIFNEAKKIENIFNSNMPHAEIFKSLFDYVIKNNLNGHERLKSFMEFILNNYYCDKEQLSKEYLNKLKIYFANFMTEQTLLYKEKIKRIENRKKNERKVERIKCPVCFGLRYNVLNE